MLDIGLSEMLVIGVVAVLVMQPQDGPRLVRTVLGLIRKVRMQTEAARGYAEALVKQADLADTACYNETRPQHPPRADAPSEAIVPPPRDSTPA